MAEEIREELKEKLAYESVEKAFTAWQKGQILDAIHFYEVALDLFSQLGKLKEMANVLEKLGDIYYLRQNLEKALKAYKACLDICENFEDELSTCIICEKIVYALREKGEYERCLTYLYRILEIAEKYRDPHRAGRALAGIAECCLKLKRLAQAREALELAHKIFKKMGAIEQTKILEESLTKLKDLEEKEEALDNSPPGTG